MYNNWSPSPRFDPSRTYSVNWATRPLMCSGVNLILTFTNLNSMSFMWLFLNIKSKLQFDMTVFDGEPRCLCQGKMSNLRNFYSFCYPHIFFLEYQARVIFQYDSF